MSAEGDAREFWNVRYADSAGELWGRGPNRWVEQLTTGLPPGRAVDLGSGDGRNAVWLAQRGHDVTALDVSDVAIDQLRERARQLGVSVDARVADLTVEDLGVDEFDLVVHSFVHLAQPSRSALLRRAGAAVKPGGWLVLVAHPLVNHSRGVGGPPDPQLLPTEEEVRADLADLDVLQCDVHEREVEGADRPALDLVVLAQGVR